MADTFTPQLNLTQPEVGASADTWGAKINTDLAVLDALFAATGAGTVLTRDGTGRALLGGLPQITGAAATARAIQLQTVGVMRWLLGEDATAEGGANAGSNWFLNRYADNGSTLLGTSLAINRATGVATFETTPMSGANTILHTGNVASLTPEQGAGVGSIIMWAGASDPAVSPNGTVWLICDGRAISRSTYATYFARVGASFGAGDGVTTVNIPKQDERVIVGKSATQTLIPQYDARVLGGTFGEGRHTMTVAELAAHFHAIFLKDPGHAHTTNAVINSGGGIQAGGGVGFGGATINPNTTGITLWDTAALNVNQNQTGPQGSTTPFNVVQHSLVLNYIIRVA
jgi:microcystin-dependent protein